MNKAAAVPPPTSPVSYAAGLDQARARQRNKMEFIRISEDERERERALRQQFADFWRSASGEPRSIYDTFISATATADDVVLAAVNDVSVPGWWIRPQQAEP